MITDARTIPEGATIHTDICIVGAGTAGITLARELIGRGMRVCILESGGEKPDRKTQSLYRGENVGLPYYPLDTARARWFGGSSHRWHVAVGKRRFGARIRPLDPIDFEERDWVPHSGWPFDKAHLDPYYHRAQEICRAGRPSYATADWEDPRRRPRLPISEETMETIIFKFVEKNPFTHEYLNAVTGADNILTLLHANVTEIETSDTGGDVTGLRVACLEGGRFSVSAGRYVLAAGGIEIPRLLLISNRKHPRGLGNGNDLVGRFFMEHLHFWSGVWLPSTDTLFDQTELYNDIHRVENIPIIGKLAPSEATMRRHRLINHCIQLIPRVALKSYLAGYLYQGKPSAAIDSLKLLLSSARGGQWPPQPLKHLVRVASGVPDILGATWRKAKRRMAPLGKKRVKLYILANMTEQVPNPDSRVLLNGDTDPLGCRRVNLDWRVTPLDLRNAIRVQELMDQELREAGLGHVLMNLRENTPPGNLHGGYHHMGTTRMHKDPRQGVVDPDGKVHGVSNLYIAGPSVFPTGGHANPVLTTVALTLRLADHLRANL